MRTTVLRAWLQEDPFVPFRISMADGTYHDVLSPKVIACGPSSRTCALFGEGDDLGLLQMDLVVKIELLERSGDALGRKIYIEAPGQEPHESWPMKSWGRFTRYMQIGEDRYALRHVDVYANGYALRYDRVHWVDGFGILAEMRYDAEKWAEWWGPSITIGPSEFEAVWRAAESSPTWEQQVRSARMSKDGPTPVWLNRRQADA